MIVNIQSKSWQINPEDFGGILQNAHDDGFFQINLSNLNLNIPINEDIFQLFFKQNIADESSHAIVAAYQLSHFLNSETFMLKFGKEVARRLKICTKNGIKQILSYFDIIVECQKY